MPPNTRNCTSSNQITRIIQTIEDVQHHVSIQKIQEIYASPHCKRYAPFNSIEASEPVKQKFNLNLEKIENAHK